MGPSAFHVSIRGRHRLGSQGWLHYINIGTCMCWKLVLQSLCLVPGTHFWVSLSPGSGPTSRTDQCLLDFCFQCHFQEFSIPNACFSFLKKNGFLMLAEPRVRSCTVSAAKPYVGPTGEDSSRAALQRVTGTPCPNTLPWEPAAPPRPPEA